MGKLHLRIQHYWISKKPLAPYQDQLLCVCPTISHFFTRSTALHGYSSYVAEEYACGFSTSLLYLKVAVKTINLTTRHTVCLVGPRHDRMLFLVNEVDSECDHDLLEQYALKRSLFFFFAWAMCEIFDDC